MSNASLLLEDCWVLNDLVVALRCAECDQPQMFPKVVTGSADQVAHGFDPQRIDSVQLQVFAGGGDHIRVQVAHPVGVNLNNRNA